MRFGGEDWLAEQTLAELAGPPAEEITVEVGDLSAYLAMPEPHLHAVRVDLAWVQALADDAAYRTTAVTP